MNNFAVTYLDDDNVMAMMIVEAEDEGDAMWKVKRFKAYFYF